MRVHIIHLTTAALAARPLNHLDGRECPTCGVTSRPPWAQAKHQNHHLTDAPIFGCGWNGWLEEFAKRRTGMTEEEFGGDGRRGAEAGRRG